MSAQGSAASGLDLPKGGGAIRGIGEKFSPDLFTGTGKHSVPIALPPGRNGLQPKLSLDYSSGLGNGYFGLGWTLSVPGVRRRTSHGVPRYDDGDVFVLSGAEDLVPVGVSGVRTRYRPRSEGLFARIEHILDPAAGDDYWRVHTREGLVHLYGTPGRNGLSDPAATGRDAARKFCWMLTRTTDLFGNRIEYSYERDATDAAEAANGHDGSQPLLRQIRYAETLDGSGAETFLVTVTFDYEDRPDRFSDHRSGFEIRTRQRCSGILVATHFDRLRKVRRHALRYQEDRLSGLSLLSELEVIGFDDAGQEHREMPPLTFGWTEFDPLRAARRGGLVAAGGLDQPERSLAADNYELIDLNGDGLPDVIRMDGVCRYWRNLGAGRLDRMRIMDEAPPLALAAPGVRLLDADGDARADLYVSAPAGAGSFALNFSGEWDSRSYRRQAAAPGFDLDDPQVRLIDLDGNGITDALRTGSRLEAWINDPAAGWKLAAMTPRLPAADFPDVFFADQRVKTGDMNGDGLADIVMIHSGRVDTWPNLGHGKWGRRVTMRRAPQLPPDYDPRRLLVGDVDGDGAADLLYVENGCVRLWVNRSGNAWSDEITIFGTPPVTDMDSVRLCDFLGQGVSGILWSRDAGSTVEHRLLFLDLSGGVKPRLLCAIDSQMGAVTRIEYAASTAFYLEDEKNAATRWKTRLPFPVQVVSRVEVIDEVGQSRLATRFRYRHGYWDGVEREFRGFGLVEQYDTETFDQWHGAGISAAMDFRATTRRQFFSPPTLTKSWFHLGAVGQGLSDWAELDYSAEYHSIDAPLLPPAPPPAGLSHAARRDAVRAMRGRLLRSELYALDHSAREKLPYTVTETQNEVVAVAGETLAPGIAREPRGIFFARQTGHRVTEWERGDDPRSVFKFIGDFDGYGRARKQTEIACPRGWRSMNQRPGQPYLAKRTRTDYTTRDDASGYVIDRVIRVAISELKNNGQVRVNDLRDGADPPVADLLAHKLTFYDGTAFTGLPFGQLGTHAVPVRTEELALTEALLTAAFGGVPVYLQSDTPNWASAPEYPAEFRNLLRSRAGYLFSDGSDGAHVRGWYAITQALAFDAQRPPASGRVRGLTVAQRDALGFETVIGHTAELLPSTITAPNNLTTTAEYDFRAVQLRLVTGPNGDRQLFSWTPLGMLAGRRHQGAGGEGDASRAGISYSYDFQCFRSARRLGRIAPVFVRKIEHSEHDTSPDPDVPIETRQYSDGFGRLVQTRRQAADVMFGDLPFAGGLLPADQARESDTVRPFAATPADPAAPSVAVSGWQVFDNKGQVVEQFEPFHDKGWDYAAPSPAQLRAKLSRFHDPLGRAERTVQPDGSEQRIIQGIPERLDRPDKFTPTPWEAYAWDANDNAGRTHAAAAGAFSTHWNTPTSLAIDPLARAVRSVTRKGPGAADEVITISAHDLGGNVTAITDALGRPAFRYVYDLLNRRLRVDSIDAGTRLTLADAAGREIEARDGRGALTLSAADEAGRPIRVWARADGAAPTTLRQRVLYGDSAQSGLSRAQAAAANLLGRLSRHFDEAGLLTCERCDFKGNQQRKVRQVIADAAIVAGFDPANPRGFTVDWDAPPALEPTAHATDATYDALNRVKSVVTPQAVDGTRRTLRVSYDRSGAIEQAGIGGQRVIERLAYDAGGRRVLALWGNGLMTRYAHDPATGRLQRRRTEPAAVSGLTVTPQGNPIEDVAYDYDLIGNVLAIRHREKNCGLPAAPDRLDRLFTYDPLYRLATATGREADLSPPTAPWDDAPRHSDHTRTRGWSEGYGYDDAGNLLSLAHTAGGIGDFRRDFDLAAGSNRLAQIRAGGAGLPATHDVNGNRTGEADSRHFEWDQHDRLRAFFVQATPGNAASLSSFTHYLYDGAGVRVKKLTRNQQGHIFSTTYIGDLFEQQREHGVENNTLHVLDGPRRLATIRVGQAFPDDATPAVKFMHGDHLDSCALTTDAAGALIAREDYTPWGETSFGGFARKRYRLMGRERDAESGLYYCSARYYAPGAGRWMSCDPAGSAAGLNLYRYANSNPMLLTDPGGRMPVAPNVVATPVSFEDGLRALQQATDEGGELAHGLFRTLEGEFKLVRGGRASVSGAAGWERVAFSNVGGESSLPAGAELDAMIARGPRQQIIYARGEWTYISMDAAGETATVTRRMPDGRLLESKWRFAPENPHAAVTRWVPSAETPLPSHGGTGGSARLLGFLRNAGMVAGAALSLIGPLVGGLQVGTGLNEVGESIGPGMSIADDKKLASGATNIGTGAASLAADFVLTAAATAGTIGAGTAAGLGMIVGGSVTLLGDSIHSAINHEESAVEYAQRYYGERLGNYFYGN